MQPARVAELVDALDLGSSAVRCASSSLAFRTNKLALSRIRQLTAYLSCNLLRINSNIEFQPSPVG